MNFAENANSKSNITQENCLELLMNIKEINIGNNHAIQMTYILILNFGLKIIFNYHSYTDWYKKFALHPKILIWIVWSFTLIQKIKKM